MELNCKKEYEVYTPEVAKAIIELFDTRSYSYRNLITFKQFQQDIELLKPRKSGQNPGFYYLSRTHYSMPRISYIALLL